MPFILFCSNLKVTKFQKYTRQENIMYEGFPVITTLVWKICEQIVTLPFHFDHLTNQVQKSLYWVQGLESTIIFAHFSLGLAVTEPFVSKKSKQI